MGNGYVVTVNNGVARITVSERFESNPHNREYKKKHTVRHCPGTCDGHA